MALEQRDERLRADLDLAVGLAHGDRPGGDAAHHHALEHRLTAHRSGPRGAQRLERLDLPAAVHGWH